MKNTERLMATIRMLKRLIMKPNFSELARTYKLIDERLKSIGKKVVFQNNVIKLRFLRPHQR